MLSGKKLEHLRYIHGISQTKMAKWCDCTPRFIRGVEDDIYCPSEEIYNAMLNCIYGVGEPIHRENKRGVKKERTE